MRKGIEKNHEWCPYAHIWVTNTPKCGEGASSKKRLGVQKSPLKTVVLATKLDKLVTEKSGNSKQPQLTREEFRADGELPPGRESSNNQRHKELLYSWSRKCNLRSFIGLKHAKNCHKIIQKHFNIKTKQHYQSWIIIHLALTPITLRVSRARKNRLYEVLITPTYLST